MRAGVGKDVERPLWLLSQEGEHCAIRRVKSRNGLYEFISDVIPGGPKVVHAVPDPEWKSVIETLQSLDAPHLLSPVVLRPDDNGVSVRPSDPKNLSLDQSGVNLSLLDFGTSPVELGAGGQFLTIMLKVSGAEHDREGTSQAATARRSSRRSRTGAPFEPARYRHDA